MMASVIASGASIASAVLTGMRTTKLPTTYRHCSGLSTSPAAARRKPAPTDSNSPEKAWLIAPECAISRPEMAL